MANNFVEMLFVMKALMNQRPARTVIGEKGLINIAVSCPVNGVENFNTHADLIMSYGDFLLFKMSSGDVMAVRSETVLAINARLGAFDEK